MFSMTRTRRYGASIPILATPGGRRTLQTSTIPLCKGIAKSTSQFRTHRSFSSGKVLQLRLFSKPENTSAIRFTPPAWKHPMYSEEAMREIIVAHRETKDWSDWAALGMVRVLRWGTDLLTGYRHDPRKPYVMNERKWMLRFIFLETVAGVPGMVGGMLRHLKSLRGMRRDNGWIETLLEEAYNERMHLLTFLTMAQPGLFMRFMVLGAQGVFFNGMVMAYMVSPRTCHRFVGYLEEEAVRTYTYAIQDIEEGRLPQWRDLDAPEIAVSYWQMPEGKRKMVNLLLYIRADEAKHREVNHTLSNLKQAQDPNPYVSVYRDDAKQHPTTSIGPQKPGGWERKDVI